MHRLIEAYGAQAIYGRTLGAGEVRRMNAATNIVAYYRQRAASGDWVAWARDNPNEAEYLNIAMIAARDGE